MELKNFPGAGVAEEAEDAGAQASGAPDTSGLAIDLAMEEARRDPTLHADVARFLRNKNSLVDVQKHHLHEQFKRLRMGVISDRLTIGLKLLTGFVGLAVAASSPPGLVVGLSKRLPPRVSSTRFASAPIVFCSSTPSAMCA